MALKYAKITGKFTIMVADTGDAGEEPNEVPCDSGQVKFTPQVKRVQTGGRFMTPQVVIASIDSTGTLNLNGNPEVLLLDLGDTNLPTHIPRTGTNSGAWKVEFISVMAGGQSVSGLDSFFINPNADDNDQPSGQVDSGGNLVQKNDLSILSPLPAAGGAAAIVVGPAGKDGVVQAIKAGANVTVDSTDPANPIISATGGGGGGTALTSYADQVEALPDYPATFPPDLTGVAPGDIGAQPAGSYLSSTGTAAAANKLATPRAINGVSFDGTAAITVSDATKVPTTRTVAGQSLSADVSAATMKTALGVDQVNNTSDANKPVSAAQQTAINAVADSSMPILAGAPVGRFRGFLTADPSNLVTGDWWFIVSAS